MLSQKVQKFLFRHSKNKGKNWLFVVYGLILLILGGGLFFLLQPKYAGSGVSITPKYKNIENPNYFFYELAPGTSFEDTATVINPSEESMSVRVYALDEAEGSTIDNFALDSIYDEPKDQNEVGAWISFNGDLPTFVIGPKKSQDVDFLLSIPESTPLGEYWGGVTVNYVPEELAEGESGVVSEVQVAARVRVKVTDDPKIIERQEVEAPKIAWKYIWASLIITSVAVLMIFIAQLKEFQK